MAEYDVNDYIDETGTTPPPEEVPVEDQPTDARKRELQMLRSPVEIPQATPLSPVDPSKVQVLSYDAKPSTGPRPIPTDLVRSVQNFEGYRPTAFRDVGTQSIGYGSTPRHPGEVLSREQATARLQEDLDRAAAVVDRENPNLPEGTRNALISLTQNGVWTKWVNSGLGDAVRRGDPKEIAEKLVQYNKGGGRYIQGLQNRRNQEASWIDQTQGIVNSLNGKPQIKVVPPTTNLSPPTSDPGELTAHLARDKDPSHVTGLAPQMQSRLAAMIANAPPDVARRISINSGYRSPERQAEIFADGVRKHGSVEAARKWVAPPGRSLHNFGMAADLERDPVALRWIHANADRFGLKFPLGHEDWHIEMVETRGGPRFDDRQTFSGKGSLDPNMLNPIPSALQKAPLTGGANQSPQEQALTGS